MILDSIVGLLVPQSPTFVSTVGPYALLASQCATTIGVIVALTTFIVGTQSARKDRRMRAVEAVTRWFEERRGKFKDLLQELDRGIVQYDMSKELADEKGREIQSLLSTLDYIAMFISIGNARYKDVTSTPVGYWFMRTLDDPTMLSAIVHIKNADQARGYPSALTFPHLIKYGPKITGKIEHKKIDVYLRNELGKATSPSIVAPQSHTPMRSKPANGV